MNIRINGNDIDYQLDREETLGQILGVLEHECEKNGMTITSISVDGEAFHSADLDGLFSRSPDDVATLDLETMSGPDIVAIIHRIGERMAAHAESLIEIPILLQTGEDSRVMESIHSFAEDFESLCQSLPLMKTISERDIAAVLVEDTPLEQYPSRLTPLLGELIEAIKSNDTVLIGDISEYELAPKLQSLASVLITV